VTRTLAGKTVFVSGGSRGIGKAIALRCAKDGANVVIAGKSHVKAPRLPGTIHEAAAEWVEYNTLRALPYMGPQGPIVVYVREPEGRDEVEV
jgi:citronellol/citronellal dehydrogenase